MVNMRTNEREPREKSFPMFKAIQNWNGPSQDGLVPNVRGCKITLHVENSSVKG